MRADDYAERGASVFSRRLVRTASLFFRVEQSPPTTSCRRASHRVPWFREMSVWPLKPVARSVNRAMDFGSPEAAGCARMPTLSSCSSSQWPQPSSSMRGAGDGPAAPTWTPEYMRTTTEQNTKKNETRRKKRRTNNSERKTRGRTASEEKVVEDARASTRGRAGGADGRTGGR